MSSREFTEWMAYYLLDPFGHDRLDINSAIVAKTVADVNTPRDKDPQPLEVFLPKFAEDDEGQEVDTDRLKTKLAVAFGTSLPPE